MDGTHKIFYVEELHNHGTDEVVYGVYHCYDGIVSVWNTKDIAEDMAEDYENGAMYY